LSRSRSRPTTSKGRVGYLGLSGTRRRGVPCSAYLRGGRGQFCSDGSASVGGLPSGRLTSSNEGMWVLVHHDSSAAPQTVQTASPVCGTKNFSSVRLYSAPQLHRTIVAILGICPCGTPDQPQCLCPKTLSHHFTPAGTALRPSWSYLRAGAAGVWRVDPAPNDPGLLAAKGGAAGDGCALMRTLGAIPAAIVTGMDRINCPITQIFRYRLTKRHRAGAPSPTTAPPMRDAQKASFDSLQPKGRSPGATGPGVTPTSGPSSRCKS
jgi:hypothetical protein